MRKLTCLSLCLFTAAACGDNVENTPDAGTPDGSGAVDAPPDAAPYVPPSPFAIPLSAAGSDQLMAVAPGPSGTFYAAGFAAVDLQATTPRNVVVVKLTATGALDPSFGGGDGIATTDVAFKGGADEIDIATQADGKIIVSATVAAATPNATDAADTDIALLRLEADGDLDPTFGVSGVRVHSLNESFLDTSGANPTVRGRDGVRGVAIGPNDQIFVHAYQRGEGLITGGSTPRIDTEFVVARFTAAGALDTAYGTGGKFLLDIFAANTHSNATPRGLEALADGSVIAGGYASTAATGNTVQPVLYKVNGAGTALVAGFADQGLFHEVVLATQTEIYDVAFHGTTMITAGYGRNSGSTNDWVSMKFDTTTGARDPAFGGAAQGAVLIDPSGMMLGSNCRTAVALPNGSTALIGSTGPASMPAQDAAFVVLRADGTLDPAFGDGVHTFQLGSNGNDQLWGGAVSDGKALLVGWQGGGASPTATLNDDSYGIVLAMP